MPRRAPEGSRKRTRTGCQRCRLRKIKCDESKPICRQCLAKGFTCHSVSTLKWEEDYQTRGLAFGRRGIWSKGPLPPEHRSLLSKDEGDITWCVFPSIRPYSFVNSTVNASEGGFTTLRKDRDTCTSVAKASFVHYEDIFKAEDVASPMAPSPFASLIFPFSISNSSAVLKSLMALSACHLAKLDTSFKTTALRLGDGVLGHLKARLEMEDTSHVALDPEILVLMMILCLIEIINECDKRWLVHLKGARDLILVRRQARLSMGDSISRPYDELVEFSERFFAYQDVIGRTACGEEPIFGGDFWTAHATGSITDPWLGCSPELVSMLCTITELSRQRAENAAVASSAGFQLQSSSLEHRLGRLEQKMINPEDDILQTIAELKRLSASLYLDCALRDAHPTLPRVNVATRQILRLISVLLERNTVNCLAWPIFVAAVELDPLEDLIWTTETMPEVPRHGRPFVLYALNKMVGSSVSNISQTRSVIEKVWQFRDMEVSSDEGHGRNDWERYVAPLCHGLSLG
ncbi:hypothetical protein VP1G_09040 [Cytospora mali]|uniref:Zn(2)-C6 fungal-type domain-containing protein n=1 Tax=Cytospora mali TaxID=578113 RepID=A0A194VD16_CYTMA|nr:hypothetical protein VP1G_09040 [Valsa mali var. pyri (nom. inval.)]